MAHGVTEGDEAARAEALTRKTMTPGELLNLSLLWFPINMFWTAMLLFILPVRVQELVGEQNKGAYLGVISIVGATASAIVQLLIAPLSDGSGAAWGRRRPFIFWGILVNVAASIGFALTGRYEILLLCYFVIQLAQNTASAPYQALIPDNIHPSQDGIASAYMGGALLVGQLFGALILLGRNSLGIPLIMYIIVGLMMVAALITVRFVPDRPAHPHEQQPLGKALGSLFTLNLRQYPDFLRLMGSRFFINLCYNTITAFLFYYVQDTLELGKEGASSFQPILALVATVAGLIGTVAAAYGLKRITKIQMVYVSCALLAVAAVVFSLTSGTTMALLLGFLFGAGWGAFQAVDWALAVNLLPPGGAARYMAVWHLCLIIPQVIAPLFGGFWDKLNAQYGHGFGWRMAFLITVVYLALGVWIISGAKERPTQAAV